MCESIKAVALSAFAVLFLSLAMLDITHVTSGQGYQEFAETVIKQPGR